jgi:bacillithiol system protein YtxJ
MTGPSPVPLTAEADLAAACDASLAVIYKHSPACGLSRGAAHEVRRFMESHPDVPVYQVDVLGGRPLSREIARRLDVRHESPQVSLVRDGAAVWDASHGGVRAASLARELVARGL